MKYLHSLTLKPGVMLLLAAYLTTPAFAHSNGQTCADKRQAIEKQINEAKIYHNKNELSRLSIAKEKITENCHDGDLQEKYQNKVEELEQKLSDSKEKLQQAKTSGNQNKITRAQKRVDKITVKLQEAKTKQAQFHRNLTEQGKRY